MPWGYLDKAGNVAIDFVYEHAIPFHQGRACVRQNGRTGYIDLHGRFVVPPIFDPNGSGSFVDDLAPVMNEKGKCGYIDRSGNMQVPASFDYAGAFSGGLAAVEVDGEFGLIDKSGDFVIHPKYDEMGEFSGGLVWAIRNQEAFYINREDKIVFGPFQRAFDFQEDVATVYNDGAYCLLHLNGTRHQLDDCEFLSGCSEGMCAYHQNGRSGFLNKHGYVVVEPTYDNAARFREGKAAVVLDGKWGAINPQNELVVPCKFDALSAVYEGIACARLEGRTVFLQLDGSILFETEYRAFSPFHAGLTPAYAAL